MSFGNPRFMFDHLLRVFGSTFVTGPEDANFPRRRLVDGLNGPLWKGDDGSAIADIQIARLFGTFFANRPPYQRIIIPTTLQSFNPDLQRVVIKLGATNPPTVIATLADGTKADIYPAPDLWDFELQNPSFDTRLLVEFYNTVANVVQQAGEIFASGIFEPSVGHIPVWEDVDEPNNLIATTAAGNTYALSRGDPRRIWRLRYEQVPEADAFQFDTMRRTAGIQLNGFWFDPPSRGDARVEIVPMANPTPLGTWSFSNVLVQQFVDNVNSNPPGTFHHLQGSAAAGLAYSQFDLNTPVDMRGRFLSVDVWAAAAVPFDGPNTSAIALSSDGFVNRYTEFELAKVFTLHTADSVWRRVFIDHTINSPNAAASSSDETPDWSAINSIRLITRPDAARFFRFAHVDAIRKESRPTFVELLDYDKRQSSRNPGVQVRYDIDLTVREVLS